MNNEQNDRGRGASDPAREPATAVSKLGKFLSLLTAQTLELVHRGEADEQTASRLMLASTNSSKRVLVLLQQALRKDRYEGFWEAIHLLKGQANLFDMSKFSTRSQRAMSEACSLRKSGGECAADMRPIAINLATAVREILRAYDT